MRSVIRSLICAGIAAASLAACQSAEVNLPTGSVFAPPAALIPVRQDLPPGSTFLPAGKNLKSLPPGFISFCLREQDQCAAAADQTEWAHMDGGLWAKLSNVNELVNTSVTPESDQQHFGRAEYWSLVTDGFGDCEDYALTKRKNLIEQGVPSRSLRIAIVRTPGGERHAVLTVATDQGDYVLDNLRSAILPWWGTGYVWLSRQGAHGGWEWVALDS